VKLLEVADKRDTEEERFIFSGCVFMTGVGEKKGVTRTVERGKQGDYFPKADATSLLQSEGKRGADFFVGPEWAVLSRIEKPKRIYWGGRAVGGGGRYP